MLSTRCFRVLSETNFGFSMFQRTRYTGQYIATLERRQGLKAACLEEIAFRAGWISAEQVERMAQPMLKNGYGQYLLRILKERVF